MASAKHFCKLVLMGVLMCGCDNNNPAELDVVEYEIPKGSVEHHPVQCVATGLNRAEAEDLTDLLTAKEKVRRENEQASMLVEAPRRPGGIEDLIIYGDQPRKFFYTSEARNFDGTSRSEVCNKKRKGLGLF